MAEVYHVYACWRLLSDKLLAQSIHFPIQPLEKLGHVLLARHGQRLRRGGVKTHFGELEEKFVIRGMAFARFFLAGGHKFFGRLAGKRLTGERRISHGASDADCAGDIEFVAIEKDFGFQSLRGLRAAKAVRADAMQNGFDPRPGPALGEEDVARKLGGSQMMGGAIALAVGRGVGGIVQQHGREQDFHICTFSPPNAFGETIDAQDMIEVVNGIGVGVPLARLFDCGHARLLPPPANDQTDHNPGQRANDQADDCANADQADGFERGGRRRGRDGWRVV